MDVQPRRAFPAGKTPAWRILILVLALIQALSSATSRQATPS
jgi:hypothetical protein